MSDRLEERLGQATGQMLRYAEDLRRSVAAERAKTAALAAAHLRLQVLDRLKSEFLSFISHELRTPLNAMSAIGMLDAESRPEDYAAVATMVRQGYERLQAFVCRGLEYFDILAMDPPAEPIAVELRAVVQQAVTERPALAGAGLTLVGPVPVVVLGDADQLAALVGILLDNACKFAQGVPAVIATVEVHGAMARLSIADRGRGFPSELAMELFHPFTVPDQHHHAHGSGLSLPLARAIVERHGGTIRASSDGEGSGATFVVELPIRSPKGT